MQLTLFQGILLLSMSFRNSRLLFSLFPLLLIDSEETPINQSEQSESEIRDDDPSDAIYCMKCGIYITRRINRTKRDGRFEHVCTNPGGHIFRIGCLNQAPGCLVLGEPTDFFTWFPGFAWSFAVCRNCSTHLGWQFRSSIHHFFGLILDALTGW